MLTAARQEIRTKLEASRHVTDSVQLEHLWSEGKEAANFLRHAIMQAAANPEGNFGTFSSVFLFLSTGDHRHLTTSLSCCCCYYSPPMPFYKQK